MRLKKFILLILALFSLGQAVRVNAQSVLRGKRFITTVPFLPVADTSDAIVTTHLMTTFKSFIPNLDTFVTALVKKDGINVITAYNDYYNGSQFIPLFDAAQRASVKVIPGIHADAHQIDSPFYSFREMVAGTFNHPAQYKHNGKRVYYLWYYRGQFALNNNNLLLPAGVTRDSIELWATPAYPGFDFNAQTWHHWLSGYPADTSAVTELFTHGSELGGAINFGVAKPNDLGEYENNNRENIALGRGANKVGKVGIGAIVHNYASASYVSNGFQNTLQLIKNVLALPPPARPKGLGWITANDVVESSAANEPVAPAIEGLVFIPPLNSYSDVGAETPYPILDNSGISRFCKPWLEKFKKREITPVVFTEDKIFSWYLLHPLDAPYIDSVPQFLKDNRPSVLYPGSPGAISLQGWWELQMYHGPNGTDNIAERASGNQDVRVNQTKALMPADYADIKMAAHLVTPARLRIIVGGETYTSTIQSGPDGYFQIPLQLGTPVFQILNLNGSVRMSAVGLQPITNSCWPGGWRPLVTELKPVQIDTTGYHVLTLTPDLERRPASVSGNQVTMNRAATSADVGKVVAIKGARLYPNFRDATISWNGIVTGISAGKLIVGGDLADPVNQLHDTAGVELIIATNRWDTIRQAIQTAISLNKHLYLNHTGEIYCNPILSPGFSSSYIGASDRLYGWLVDTDTFHFRGIDSAKTKIKFGPEDRASVPDDNNYPTYFYVFANSSKLEVSNTTFEGPDRGSTTTNNAMGFLMGYGGQRSSWLHDMQLISKNPESSWMEGVTELNRFGADGAGFNGKKLINSTKNSTIQAAATYTMYSQNGPVKRLEIKNTKITGGGAKMFLGPYVNALSTSFTGGQGTVVVNNPNASFYQSITGEWPAYHPYCLLFPPSEGTVTVRYDGPGINGQDSYGPGSFVIANVSGKNFADGNEHFVKFAWHNGINPVTQTYNFQPGQGFTLARTLHSNSGTQVKQEDDGYAGYAFFERVMRGGLPVRFKYSNGRIQFLDPLEAIVKDVIDKKTATLWNCYMNEGGALVYTEPVSESIISLLNGGSIIMQGRPQAIGYGHTLYTHVNAEHDLDSIYYNLGVNAQYTNYAIRVSASSQTAGPNTVFNVTNWFSQPAFTGYPWKSSLSYLQPSVQVFNSIEPGSLVFTGTANFGRTIVDRTPGGQILIPYNVVENK